VKPNANATPAGNTCFKCGQLGHYANACPQRQKNNNGRVNHVKLETAEEAPNVVVGTFLVNSCPATILFDTGASHTFISAQFVEKHNSHLYHAKHHDS